MDGFDKLWRRDVGGMPANSVVHLHSDHDGGKKGQDLIQSDGHDQQPRNESAGWISDTHGGKDHSPVIQSHFLDNFNPRVHASQKDNETQASFYPGDGNKASPVVHVRRKRGSVIRHPGL